MKSANDVIVAVRNSQTPDKKNKPEFVPFYDVKYSGVDVITGKESIRTIRINYAKLVNLLRNMGYRRLDIARQAFVVKIVDNVVEEVSQRDVVDEFVKYLESFGENMPDGVMVEMLLSRVYEALSKYFSDAILHRLVNEKPIVFNEHTKDSAFFYYQNGYVKVTKHGINLMPYQTLTHYIWKNQILQRDFKLIDKAIFMQHAWARFVQNVADCWTEHPLTKVQKKADQRRLISFQTILGYSLHSYYEGKLKAVIFTDARMTEDAAGRSGKTLLCKALGQILNAEKYSSTYIELNGKDFDATDRFKYQELTLDTRLVHINDAARNFPFEALFNDITEGIRAQRKNEKPFPVAAKMIISTNRTIRIHGDSARDRSIEFEFADYYGADHSPEREFGHWFFRDWTTDDWTAFDNHLLYCVSEYLNRGLVEAAPINLLVRKLYEETSNEFVRFMEECAVVDTQEYDKRELYERFLRENSDYRLLKQKTFTRWLRIFGDFHPDYLGSTERRTNGKDMISFKVKPKDSPTQTSSDVF
jgi:hypothetical protein